MKLARSSYTAVLIVCVVIVMLESLLSLIDPVSFPRLSVLPAPSDQASHPVKVSSGACDFSNSPDSFARRGLFWELLAGGGGCGINSAD